MASNLKRIFRVASICGLRSPFSSLLMAVALLLVLAASAPAVIIFETGKDEPTRGYLVRQSDQAVEIREVLADGSVRPRTIPRSQIDRVLVVVSNERLEALSPESPRGYLEYAEELREKRRDPDAEITALRLYLIAAWLAPEELGRSALLGMTALARSPEEQQRFRAFVYLLDPSHDRAVLRRGTAPAPAAGPTDTEEIRNLVAALRHLRRGERREALQMAERHDLEELFGTLALELTFEQFTQACDPICSHCRRGRQDCPRCEGVGTVAAGARTFTCTRCNGSRRLTCLYCGSNYRNPRLEPEVLARVVRSELQLTAGDAAPAVTTSDDGSTWGDLVTGVPAPVRSLRLESITELDPRKCVFRDGQWQVP